MLHTLDLQIYSSRVLFVITQSLSTHRFSSFHRYTFCLQQIRHIFSWLCRCREYILSSVCSRIVGDSVDAFAIVCMLIVGLLAVSHTTDSGCSSYIENYIVDVWKMRHMYIRKICSLLWVCEVFFELGDSHVRSLWGYRWKILWHTLSTSSFGCLIVVR